MMNDHLNTTPDLEPMPEAEKEVVLRAMSKDPTKRFASCKEFVQALDLATRKERGVPMPAHGGAALSEAPTADSSQGQTDPWSTIASPLPATMQDRQSTAGRTVPWKPPPVPKWPLWAGIGVTLVALIAMGVYSLRHHKESDPAENLPSGFKAVGMETVEDIYKKKYFKQIVKIFDGDLEAKFVCIPKETETLTETIADPETYYIMLDKVSIGLFRKFADQKGVPEGWNKDNDPNNRKLPVMNVLPLEAYEFAQDMFGKKSNLPKKIQWEKATGYFLQDEELEGPFVGHWKEEQPLKIALSPKTLKRPLERPREIGTSEDDISPYGCRDMAGNGREWLRDVHGLELRFLPHVTEGDTVLIWGKSFADPDPFFFYGDKSDIKVLGSGRFSERISDVGFRAVIETVDTNK
jgi:formylglycine-generating enzyme required for sulfatase activity